MAENKVSVEISLEQKAALKSLSQLSKEIQGREKDFEKLGNAGDKSFSVIGEAGKGVASGFGSLVKGVTVANLASEAIIGVANKMREFVAGSVNAAIVQENAINKLNQSLRASGSFSEAATGDLQAFATNLQKVSVHGDEVVIGQLAMAKSLGATNEQSKELVQAAANLAATFGGSLESNVEKLGKTFSGSAGKLAKYIPELEELTEAQLKSGAAFDIVNKKFSGAAANELESYGGKVTAMTNAYSDLQEALGGFVTGSDAAKNSTSALQRIFETLTQKLTDYQTELKRGENGFQENQESVNQLSREYENLGEKIEALEKRGSSLPKGLDSFDTSKLKVFRSELEALQTQIKNAQTEVLVTDRISDMKAKETGAGGVTKEDQKLVDSRKEAYAQLEIAQASYNQAQVEQDVAKQVITEENYTFELERLQSAEAMKIEAVYNAEVTKANLKKDAQEKSLLIQKAGVEKEIALEKSGAESKKKIDAQALIVEQQNAQNRIQLVAATANLASALAKDGSKEQFIIQKAASIAQAVIATQLGMAQALALGPIVGPPLAAKVGVMGGINVAAILATAIKGYEHGGIVGGNGKTTGDSNIVAVNSREMILNRGQQAELFNIANGQGGGNNGVVEAINRLVTAINGQPINLTVDGRVLATVIRKEVKSGFKLA
jgi:hypothetical protein